MMATRVRFWVQWLTAVVLGVLAALLVLGSLAHLVRLDLNHTAARVRQQPHSARTANPQRSAKLALIPMPSAPPKDQPIVKPADDRDFGQIVQTARPDREQRPTKAKYLSRYDMTVARETKARDLAKASRDLGRVRVDEPSEVQSLRSKSKEASAVQVKRQRKVVDGEPSTQPIPKAGAGELVEIPSENKPIAQAGGSVVVRGSDTGLLLPATSANNVLRNLQALSGNAGHSDYLPDVDDEGETNLLNTRKFRYWDFFERIRERVGQEWEPGRVWRSRDPTGQRFGVKSRLTIVHVRLDTEGGLKVLQVSKECGLDFLDDEARRAFAAAGPFPNPPVGLKNEHGEIEFRFGFMFEITSQRFRLRGWQ